MRMVKLCAMLLAMILGLRYVAPNLAAQEDNSRQQEQKDEQQKENKNSEPRKGPHQDSKDQNLPQPLIAYRLEFTLTELDDGRKVNSRTYSVLAQVGHLNKLRIGGRVPVETGGGGQKAFTNFQYLDVGMNIDCSVQEREGVVLLNATFDSSNIASQREEQTHQPIIRQARSEVMTILSPGKPTLVSSMDDPTTRARFQLEVTATKMK